MNAHTPFDAKQDWTNPFCQNSSNDPMVDALLGNAYHVVRTVYCNLGNLKLIYDFLNKYGMVLGVQSETELKAMPTSASYVRLYGFDNTNKRVVTDYLYVEGDRTGVIPDDPSATGSWILVATSNSDSGGDDGDGKASPPYIPYAYNNGSAIGGETTIPVPAGTVGVPMIVIDGYTNLVGYGFTYDAPTLTVTLAQPLEPGDEVHLFLTGTPAVPDNPNVSDWVQINWLYNGGYASGGEQVIQIPYTFQSVPAIYKNGARYYAGLAENSYTVDAANQRILLSEPLATNDRLIVTIGGESRTLIMTDRTLQEVARSANVKDTEIILSTDTTRYLNGMKVIYDVVAQKIYGLPSLPTNVYIGSVSNGQLTYNPGNITVELLPVPGSAEELSNALQSPTLGDALISVKQPFNNTVKRTQHDKNAEILSIRDFYNPADTDWTNAFKRAARVSADEGKVIFVPAGKYIVSDSIPLYDDGYGAVAAPDVKSYYKGNGTKFRGEGRKTVIIKTSPSTKDINAVFYIDSTNAVPSENGKRGMEISHMSIIDLTAGSVGIYNNNGVVCSHFEDLFIMPRRVGVWLVGSFVDVTIHGVIVQGHDDSATYPMDYGFRVGSGTGTSISIDRCHVGHALQDAYEIHSQYSKIGVLSADNTGGVVYVFKEFRGHIQSLGSEWLTDVGQNSTLLKAVNSQFSVGLLSMLKKIVNTGGQLFDLDGSQINIDQVNATDSCVFSGRPARLRNSSLIDIGYFTQYKYEQFVQPIDYDANTHTFMTVGNLGGTQYRGRQDRTIHGMFTLPHAQPTGECYRIMGTKSIANQSGCVGTIYSARGLTLTRAALIMDVVCNGNGNIGTSAIAIKRAVSDPVGLTGYTGWYEGTVDGVLYMMLRMDEYGDKNLGTFFSGMKIGRDPNLFRVVQPSEITGLVSSTIGVMKTETAA